MISVEKFHPQFARRCHDLNEGESAYSHLSDIPYDIHCYADGWYALWKNPPDGQIGRRLRTWQQMLGFLHGDDSIGMIIPRPKPIKGLDGEADLEKPRKRG